MYSLGVSEEVTGALLRETFPRREDYVLATKVNGPMGDAPNDRGLSRVHVLDGIDASLRRPGVDHVDLYQIHRFDPDTPVEETMEALHDCVRSGKVRYLGASSMAAWQLAKAQHAADRGGWTRRSQPVEAIALVKRALRSVRGRSSHVKGAYGVASDGAARHP